MALRKKAIHIFLFITQTVFVISCKEAIPESANQQPVKVSSSENTGKEVLKDSLIEPLMIPIDDKKLAKIPVGKPTQIRTNANIRLAGTPIKVPVGTPAIFRPGTENISFPDKVKATGRIVTAGQPEINLAKDPYIRDHNPYSFSTFGKLQGLKHGDIICALQDRNGNIWFGTNGGGISRYDGKSFAHYTDREGLSSNQVWAALEDRQGNLWFGTYGGGIIKYDGRNFTIFTEKEGLSNNTVRAILEDRNGNLWLGTDGGGVNKFDGEDFMHFTVKQGLSHNIVRSILEDRNGNLWFGTEGGGVTRYDGNSFTQYKQKEGLSRDQIWAILEDRQGRLWFGTEGGGASLFDGKYFIHFTEENGLSNNYIYSIQEDANGNIWFCTMGGGVSMYDGKSFVHFTEKEGLINNRVWSMLEDRSGNLWFCTDGGGICKYDGRLFRHFTEYNGLKNAMVRSIVEDHDGNLWFGTDEGVSRYDGNMFTNYTEKDGLKPGTVRALMEARNGDLWIGTLNGGACRFDGKNFTWFTKKDGLGGNIVRSILEDRNGNIWFGTYGGGATLYDGKKFIQYTEKQGLGSNDILDILEDRGGNVWFATNGGGVSRFDGKSFINYTINNGLNDNEVWSVYEDQNGHFWFGTWGGGVTWFNGENFTHFTEADGLSNNYVFSILQDDIGNMWFGTRFGLSILVKERLREINNAKVNAIHTGTEWNKVSTLFRNYNYLDGFYGIGVNGGHTLLRDKNGIIWVGTNDRLTSYIPIKTYDTIPPNIQITSIELFNVNLPWAEIEHNKDTSIRLGNGVMVGNFRFQALSKWYSLPEELSLPFNNNDLTFNFIGITMNQPHLVKYRYRLEGMEENWSALTNRTSSTYGNLGPGHYTFKVIAVSSEGLWSNEYNYSFTIRPPWWRTWWMYVVYLLSSAGIVVFIIWWNGRLLRSRANRLAAEVEKATRLIRKQKNEVEIQKRIVEEQKGLAESEKKRAEDALKDLKDAQTQLIQSEKMASLGVLTAGVAHEINNPLNFINGGYIGLKKHISERGQLNTETEMLLNAIKTGVDRASGIVKGLNQFSRNNEGNQENCDIHGILENCLLILNSQFKNRIEIKKRYANEPIQIKGNSGKLHQVFTNILSNAIQAIPGPGSIFISTVKHSPYVRVEIGDTGTGISKENLSRITDPFFTTKDPGKGTGLGLSIAYSIIQEHKGSLTIESEIEKGTTVNIQLPVNPSGSF